MDKKKSAQKETLSEGIKICPPLLAVSDSVHCGSGGDCGSDSVCAYSHRRGH